MSTTKRTVEVALSTSGIGPDGRPQRTPLVVDDRGQAVALDAPPSVEPDLAGEHMLINIGPQHPVRRRVLWADVDQHVLARQVGLHRRRRLERDGLPAVVDHERRALRAAVGAEPRRGERHLDGALGRSHQLLAIRSVILTRRCARRWRDAGASLRAARRTPRRR